MSSLCLELPENIVAGYATGALFRAGEFKDPVTGLAIDLTAPGWTLLIHAKKPDGTLIEPWVATGDATAGYASYSVAAGEIVVGDEGIWHAKFTFENLALPVPISLPSVEFTFNVIPLL